MQAFDEQPHLQLLKELLTQTFATPRRHHKSKPFCEHVLAFSVADNRVWLRNYQACVLSPGLAACVLHAAGLAVIGVTVPCCVGTACVATWHCLGLGRCEVAGVPTWRISGQAICTTTEKLVCQQPALAQHNLLRLKCTDVQNPHTAWALYVWVS